METTEQAKELVIGGVPYETRFTRKFEERTAYAAPDPHAVRCVIPGVIRSVAVRRGQRVKAGDSLLVLEAMKMQNDVLAPRDGAVRTVRCSPGDAVARGDILIELE